MQTENLTETQDAIATPATLKFSRRRNGKVAQLPKVTRDKINLLIQDGVSYLDILTRLGHEVAEITEAHLCSWRTGGGYNDWLREQQKIELLRCKRDFAYDLLVTKDSTQIPQTILQLLATNVCEFLVDLDAETLRESLLSDSDKFTRFVTAMVKLADGEIKCEQFQHLQRERAALAALKKRTSAEKPGISEASLRAAEEKLNLL
jgi:hypothetical protein